MTVTYENETLTTTWSEVDGGTNYQLRWTADDGRKQWESPSRLRSHVVTPADPDTRYVVDVRAYAAGSWRSWNSVEITPSAVGAPSDPPPSAPPDDDPGSGSGAQQTVSAGGTRFTPAVTVRQEDSTLVTSWEAVADAQNYQFRHRVGSARMEWSAPDQSRTKVLTDVAYGVAHEIEVRAYVAKAWRGWTTVSITPVAPN